MGVAKVTLDANGGGALVGACGNAEQGTWLVVKEPHLRALDIHDDSLLEVLDLRGCGEQAHLHLQLDRLPRLRLIYLPVLTQGAVIHLFSMAMPCTLLIEGRVSELDADWQTDTLRLVAGKAPYQGVCLLGHDAQAEQVAAPSGDGVQCRLPAKNQCLSVVANPAILPARLHLSGMGNWVLTDASPVVHCVIDGPEKVRIEQASALETLTVCSSGAYEVAGLAALTTVSGNYPPLRETPEVRALPPGQYGARKHLTLRGAVTALTLTDAWGHIQLHTPQLTSLTLNRAKHLALHHCRALTAVALPDGLPVDCYGSVPPSLLHQARFFIDESTLAQSLARLEAGELSLLEGVLNVLSQRYTAQGAFHSLTALLRLAKQGISPEALWQCRRTLSTWQRLGGRKRKRPVLTSRDYQRADQCWGWELPADRIEEGFSADLQLWVLCMPHSTHAQAYRTTLLKEAQQRDALGYLLRVATTEQGAPALWSLTIDVLVALYGQGQWPRLTLPTAQAGVVRYLPRLLRAKGLTPVQASAILNAIANLAPWASLSALLASQLAHYPGPVRALLMTLSRQPDEWFRWRIPGFPRSPQISAAKQQLLQLALVPVSGAPEVARQMTS